MNLATPVDRSISAAVAQVSFAPVTSDVVDPESFDVDDPESSDIVESFRSDAPVASKPMRPQPNPLTSGNMATTIERLTLPG